MPHHSSLIIMSNTLCFAFIINIYSLLFHFIELLQLADNFVSPFVSDIEQEWAIVEKSDLSESSVDEFVTMIKQVLSSEKKIRTSGIRVVVNGQLHVVQDVSPRTKLVEFLRYKLGITSTKVGCGEGGCGACTVLLSYLDEDKKLIHHTINSCLRPLFLCDRMSITTSEALGGINSPLGPNVVQEKLATGNGSQCGYCSPAMCLQMCGLLVNNPKPSEEEVEYNFDGNLCRCTGYRPILHSFRELTDMEDLNVVSTFQDVEKKIKKSLLSLLEATVYIFDSTFNIHWIKPLTVKECVTVIQHCSSIPSLSFSILSGSTGGGVSKYYNLSGGDSSSMNSIVLDISRVQELHRVIHDKTNNCIEVGSLVSVSRLQQEFSSVEKLSSVADHVLRIANHQVRNAASWAGNLVLAKRFPNFGSDLQTILTCLNATLKLYHENKLVHISMEDFIKPEFQISELTLILSIRIPLPKEGEIIQSFKVAARHVNAHAAANATFAFGLSAGKGGLLIRESRLIFGGIREGVIIAKDVSNFLKGREMNEETLEGALSLILSTCAPSTASPKDVNWVPVDPNFRQSLSVSYFYKFYLFVLNCFSEVPSRIESASKSYSRPLSSGAELYSSDDSLKPISFPIPKLKSLSQTTGEAKYSDDYGDPSSLYGAFVLSTVAAGKILNIDVSNALRYPGVVDFIYSKHISEWGGTNQVGLSSGPVEIFASEEIAWIGQPIGVIVASSYKIAEEAARLVSVTYAPAESILSISDAIAKGSFSPKEEDEKNMQTLIRGDIVAGFKQSELVIEFETHTSAQQHFYMETQVSLVSPTEDGGLFVRSATQYPPGTRVRHDFFCIF